MILYMYIAPGQGLTTLMDEILMSTGTSCHFGQLLQVSKNLILYNFFHFFRNFIHVYNPGTETDSPQMSTEAFCHFIHLLQV